MLKADSKLHSAEARATYPPHAPAAYQRWFLPVWAAQIRVGPYPSDGAPGRAQLVELQDAQPRALPAGKATADLYKCARAPLPAACGRGRHAVPLPLCCLPLSRAPH
jgi:hypothetical protein